MDKILAASAGLSNSSAVVNDGLADFLAQYWLVAPGAIGVGLALWGVKRLFGAGKSLAS